MSFQLPLKKLFLFILLSTFLYGCDSHEPSASSYTDPVLDQAIHAVKHNNTHFFMGHASLNTLLQKSDSSGKFLFHYAAEYGCTDILKYFINVAKSTSTDLATGNLKNRRNIWHYAALGGHTDILKTAARAKNSRL